MKWLTGFVLLLTVALICFTSSVPPPHRAYASSGVIIINTNCGPSPSPAPATGQQVTYVDQNGNLCINSAGGGGSSATITAPLGQALAAASVSVVNPLATVAGAAVGTQGTGCGLATPANTSFKPINSAGSSSNLLLVSGVASEKVHICAINIGPAAAAVNVALVEGTTTTNPCDTSTAGMAGGATAATGWQFAANGGLTMGNGQGVVAITATAADNVCLLFSAGVQVSGVITYAVY
jgi:hypothetical protein